MESTWKILSGKLKMAENADGSKSGEIYINWNFVDVFAHFKLTDILYIVQTIYIYIKIKRK